jgi:hypothetical protein
MTNESSPNDTKNVWQNQKPEGIRMSVEEIHRKAAKFQRKVFWENALNYFLLLVGVAFACFFFIRYGSPTDVLRRLGFGMTVAAMLYMVWQTHKRSPFRRVPAERGFVSCLEFHRKELERRRDLHRSVWRWCLGPAIPGVVFLLVGMARINPNHARHPGWNLAGVITCMVLAYILGWRQSADRARKLQHQIDELDALQAQR